MVDESRLQRIEDKLDKMADIIAQQAVTQEQILNITKRQDEQGEMGKDRDKEVSDLKERMQTSEAEIVKLKKSVKDNRWLVGISILAVLSVLTGVNFL